MHAGAARRGTAPPHIGEHGVSSGGEGRDRGDARVPVNGAYLRRAFMDGGTEFPQTPAGLPSTFLLRLPIHCPLTSVQSGLKPPPLLTPPLVCRSPHAGPSRHPVRPQGPCALLAVGQAGAEYRRGAAVTTAAPTASTAATTTPTTSTTSTAVVLLLAVWANFVSRSLPGLLGSADFSHNGSLRHLAGGS